MAPMGKIKQFFKRL